MAEPSNMFDNPFLDFLEGSTTGMMGAFGAISRPHQINPRRKRQTQSLFEDARLDYLSDLSQQVLDDGAPTLLFTDFLKEYPFSQRIAQQAGLGVNDARYNPPTRFIYR